MKLATFKVGDKVTWGTIEGDSAIDLGAALGTRFSDLKSLIAEDGYAEARAAMASSPRYALTEIRWLPVVPNPEKIFCVGLNYEMHRKETGRSEVDPSDDLHAICKYANWALDGHCSPRCFDRP